MSPRVTFGLREVQIYSALTERCVTRGCMVSPLSRVPARLDSEVVPAATAYTAARGVLARKEYLPGVPNYRSTTEKEKCCKYAKTIHLTLENGLSRPEYSISKSQ